jgi:putative oxidoreductase
MIVAISELAIVISHPADPGMSVVLATFGATLAMIGPGACSIDARLFGRKEVRI